MHLRGRILSGRLEWEDTCLRLIGVCGWRDRDWLDGHWAFWSASIEKCPSGVISPCISLIVKAWPSFVVNCSLDDSMLFW